MRKIIATALCLTFILASLPLTACNNTAQSTSKSRKNVLRIASWDEYIDEGGEDSYKEGSKPIYEEFVDWYKEQTGVTVEVVYNTLQDNETMYNKIKMGDFYDLLCPSEYMIMKLASEGYLQKFPEAFFNTETETNYYAKNVSPYIKDVFDNGKLSNGSSWSEYSAGYMWGTTGFVFNPAKISREQISSWSALASPACNRQITAKDNVRDSYFMGLGMYYEKELLDLRKQYEQSLVSREKYREVLEAKMNDTSPETIKKVQAELEKMRKNVYGIETDEAKNEIIMGRLNASFQWSGDASYIIEEAEAYSTESNPLLLEYCIPESASNLWFDGWVIMKDSVNVELATAFVNFLSKPENVIRNMYYIGYTSCIGGEEVLEYIREKYESSDTEEEKTIYDLSYFFGEGAKLNVPISQTRRQLFAQYPEVKDIDRLVVMNYFDKKTNTTLNRMWNTIK